ncbi:CGNR zinc finger domain-containing protein [Pseudonocardia spinosispora]|uniref:CGNR zinc finger domain-containing protein n=1 Tax=Pseudonocardia spinosispora TaxID=103441 RepID=UPI00040DE29F|nr:CGNR zinc finger domain-containing protein [Pseudonocardia spinosispora]
MAALTLIEEFLNTVDERSFSRHGHIHAGGEQLTSPGALADWLATRDLADAGVEWAQSDLADALTFRTTLRRSLAGDVDVATVFAAYPLHLMPDGPDGLRVASRSGRRWLDVIVETVAVAVCRGDWRRIKLCAAPDCRWAFYDTSRSGRGRWCDMNVCGNRHKTRTYRERHQHAT